MVYNPPMNEDDCQKLIVQWEGYALTYQAIDPKKAARFRHLADQMRDILTLAEVKERSVFPEYKPINLVKLREDATKPVKQLKPVVRRKRKQFVLNSDTPLQP